MAVHSVRDLTLYIKGMFQAEGMLQNISVEGELSNYKMYASGHCYFTLKDDMASLKCVMFKSRARTMRFQPENGLKIIATGDVSVYERDGAYQLYVDRMTPTGAGEFSVAFEQLKKRLANEGLFCAEHKKSLPMFPQTIGVVTSISGAVLRDIYRVSKRRNPRIRIVLYPVQVQGDGAAAEIASAIRFFNEKYPVDVLIAGRGGGSMEDLWAFNEEMVVRAFYKSKIPIISAVGHETDTTLSDYASDRRAATPSQAAELAVPDTDELIRRVIALEERLNQIVRNRLSYENKRLEHARSFFLRRSPRFLLAERKQQVDMMMETMRQTARKRLFDKAHVFDLAVGKLDLLNPLHVLGRGYGIVEKKGRSIKSIREVAPGDDVRVCLVDGAFRGVVRDLQEGGYDAKEEGTIF